MLTDSVSDFGLGGMDIVGDSLDNYDDWSKYLLFATRVALLSA